MAAIGILMAITGFAVLALSKFYPALGLWPVPLIGIGLLIVSLTALFPTRIKCPSCAQLFCGPQNDIDEVNTNIFTSSCRYCKFQSSATFESEGGTYAVDEKVKTCAIAMFLGFAVIISIAEYHGLTSFITDSQLGVVERSSNRRVYMRDPEGGGREVNMLEVWVRYAVDGKEYTVKQQWTDDYWVSNGNLPALTSFFSSGSKIQVLYLRWAPAIARVRAPTSWGSYLGMLIGVGLLGVLILGTKAAGFAQPARGE